MTKSENEPRIKVKRVQTGVRIEQKMLKVLKWALENEKHQFFIAKELDRYIGYIQVSIRTDYVEGCLTSPVGYLEGIFVEEDQRKKGIAHKLFLVGQRWAAENGCTEMGSDTWVGDEGSRDFHKKLGFVEDDVLVHFINLVPQF